MTHYNNFIMNPSCKALFHSDFDIFDQYTIELTKATSVYALLGVMLQDLPNGLVKIFSNCSNRRKMEKDFTNYSNRNY